MVKTNSTNISAKVQGVSNKKLRLLIGITIREHIRSFSEDEMLEGKGILIKNNYLYIFNFSPTKKSFEKDKKTGDGFEILHKIDLGSLTKEEQNDLQKEFKGTKSSPNTVLARYGFNTRSGWRNYRLVTTQESDDRNAGLDKGKSREETQDKRGDRSSSPDNGRDNGLG